MDWPRWFYCKASNVEFWKNQLRNAFADNYHLNYYPGRGFEIDRNIDWKNYPRQ